MRSFLHPGDTERFPLAPQPDNAFGHTELLEEKLQKKI